MPRQVSCFLGTGKERYSAWPASRVNLPHLCTTAAKLCGAVDPSTIEAALLLEDLAGRFGKPGGVAPGRLADKLLQGLALLIREVGEGFDLPVSREERSPAA